MQNRLAANQRCPEQFEALIGQVKSCITTFRNLRRNVNPSLRSAHSLESGCSWSPSSRTLLPLTEMGTGICMPLLLKILCRSLKNLTALITYVMVRGILNKSRFTHPGLYRRFSMGQWVVQHLPGCLCAVGGDRKVEQTIQRVSKGHGGHYVVGATCNAGAVAEYELLFHEIGSITNLLNSLTTNQSMKHTGRAD